MTPEILHRCESCGVAIREQAMFCPECGKPPAGARQNSPDENNLVVAEASPSDQSAAAASSAVAANVSEDRDVGKDTPAVVPSAASPAKTESVESPGQERHGARERTRETLHRASSAARGAIEGNVKRVEKIHHVSSAVFEEAHYDPSLRFVLVALGLFVMFIIVLVLSKVMG